MLTLRCKNNKRRTKLAQAYLTILSRKLKPVLMLPVISLHLNFKKNATVYAFLVNDCNTICIDRQFHKLCSPPAAQRSSVSSALLAADLDSEILDGAPPSPDARFR